MTSDEYQQLTRGHNQDWIIDELQKRSLERGLVSYNLRTLLESLQKDQIFASKTHNEWGPPEVRTILMTPYSDTSRGKSTELKAFIPNEMNCSHLPSTQQYFMCRQTAH